MDPNIQDVLVDGLMKLIKTAMESNVKDLSELTKEQKEDFINEVKRNSTKTPPGPPSPREIPKPKFRPIKIKECDTGNLKLRKFGVNKSVALEIQKRENKKAVELLKSQRDHNSTIYISFLVTFNHVPCFENNNKYHLLKVPFNKDSYDVIVRSFNSIMPVLLNVKGIYYCVDCDLGHRLFYAHAHTVEFIEKQEFSGLPELIKTMDDNHFTLDDMYLRQIIDNNLEFKNKKEYVHLIAKQERNYKVDGLECYETNSLGEDSYFNVVIPIMQKNYDELLKLLKRIRESNTETLKCKDLTQLPKTWDCVFKFRAYSGFINPRFVTTNQRSLQKFEDYIKEQKNKEDLYSIDLNSTIATDNESTLVEVNSNDFDLESQEFVYLGQRSETQRSEKKEKTLEERVDKHNNDITNNTVQYIVKIYPSKKCILEIPIEPNKYMIRYLTKNNTRMFYRDLKAAKILNHGGEIYFDTYAIGNTPIEYNFLDSNQRIIDEINDKINRRYGFY